MKPTLLLLTALLFGCSDTVTEPDAEPDAEVVVEDAPLADTVGAEDAEPDATLDCAPGVPPREEEEDAEAPSVANPDAAPQLLLTINEIPASMNGSVPWTDDDDEAHPFTLRVNRERFTLDVMPLEDSGPIDWSTLALVCDQPLGAPDGGIWVAETTIGEADLEPGASGGLRLRATPETATLPDLLVTCTAEVSGDHGDATSSVTFETATLPPELDPFVTPDTWLVVLSRDIFALEVTVHPDDTATLVSTHVPDGDGILDLHEGLRALGIISADNPEGADFVIGWLLDVVTDWARHAFQLDSDGGTHADSVPIQIVFEGDPGAPDPASWDGTFSMIALGGDGKPNHQANGIVGMATLDPNNQGHEDNTVYGRGVYPTGVARQALSNPLGALLLASILPHVGTPIGGDPRDAVFLQPGFDPDGCHDSEVVDRYTVLSLAVEFGGLAIGSTLAHEIGHSLGLVPAGPPPGGLFAGVKGLAFTDNVIDDAHIDTTGLNIMQTGKVTNWMEALSQSPRFNALNLAYLKRRLVVGDE